MTPIELHAKHLGIMAWNMNYNGYSDSFNRAIKNDVQLSAVRWGICMAGLDKDRPQDLNSSRQWESS